MIIRGFFRKKSTKLYLLILSSIISILICSYGIGNYLNNLINLKFFEATMIYIESNKDYEKDLNSNQYLKNVRRVIAVENIDISSIRNFTIEQYEINKTIIYSDDDKKEKLKIDEAVLVLDETNYINYERNFDKIINNEIVFNYKGTEVSVTIKGIDKNPRRNSITISNELFQELQGNDYKYVANINNYKKLEEILNYYKNEKDFNIVLFDDSLEEDYTSRNKLKKEMSTAVNIIRLLFIILLLIMIVINNNIISDLKNNIILEYRLGYSKKNIKINILKRLFSLHILSIVLSIFMYFVIKTLMKIYLNIVISVNNFIIFLAMFLIICDLLLIIVNDKSMPRKVVI